MSMLATWQEESMIYRGECLCLPDLGRSPTTIMAVATRAITAVICVLVIMSVMFIILVNTALAV
jgi:hypothetical protein